MIEEIVKQAQNGDNTAIGKLFELYRQDIYCIGLRNTKNKDIASDIVQETFIEVIHTIHKLKEPAAFEAWIKKIAYHQCTRYFRGKDKKHELLVDNDENFQIIFDELTEENVEFQPEQALEQEEFRKIIRTMIEDLPDAQRMAILMFYYDDFSVKQIAEIQQVSQNTVLSRLNYGRKSIKKTVEEYEKQKGIKLHSVSIMPLLYWLYEGSQEEMSEAAILKVINEISAAAGISVIPVDKASILMTIKAKIIHTSFITKVVTSVVAVTVMTGAYSVGTKLLHQEESKNYTTVETEEETAIETDDQSKQIDNSVEQQKSINIKDELSTYDLIQLNEYLSCLSERRLKEYPASDEELYYFAEDYTAIYSGYLTAAFAVDTIYDEKEILKKEHLDSVLMEFFGVTINVPNEKPEARYTEEEYQESITYVTICREIYKIGEETIEVVFDIYQVEKLNGPFLDYYFYTMEASEASMNMSMSYITGGCATLVKKDKEGKYPYIIKEYQEDSALNWAYAVSGERSKIPENCSYYDASEERTIYAGEEIPIPHQGDIYRDGYYEYSYNETFPISNSTEELDWIENVDVTNSWSVRVIDKTLEAYPDILNSVAGRPVSVLSETYRGCNRLKEAPQIPPATRVMAYAFYACEEMGKAEIIIPLGVEDMEATFMWCSNLSGNIVINASPLQFEYCFWRTTKDITLYGGCQTSTLLKQETGQDNIHIAPDIGTKDLYEVPVD